MSILKKIFPNCQSPSKHDLDITNRKQVFDFFEKNSIDVIIHTAAITSVRFCEENQEIAWNTNVQGTNNLVDVIKKSKNTIKFIYISTACVFDGHRGMYKESDIPYPENFYALTKLIGENEVTKIPNYLPESHGLILRLLLIDLELICLQKMLPKELKIC